jgi:hypothetical protein
VDITKGVMKHAHVFEGSLCISVSLQSFVKQQNKNGLLEMSRYKS